MRLIFGAGGIAQDLQSFAVVDRPVEQACDACFDALAQRVLPQLQAHAVAGARGMHDLRAVVVVHGARTHQAWLRQRDQCIAFGIGQKIAQHHHARQQQADQHAYLAIAQVQQRGIVVLQQRWHAYRHRQAMCLRVVLDVATQQGFDCVDGVLFVPALIQERL